MTLIDIQKALKGAKYKGQGFFENGSREVHAMWIHNRWVFIGYIKGYAETTLKSLKNAAEYLGV